MATERSGEDIHGYRGSGDGSASDATTVPSWVIRIWLSSSSPTPVIVLRGLRGLELLARDLHATVQRVDLAQR